MAESLEGELDGILKRTQSNMLTTLLPQELSTMTIAFLPSRPASIHSKAYVVLSAICQQHRASLKISSYNQEVDPATHSLHRMFSPAVTSRVSDIVETQVLAGLSFLTALFEVDWHSASLIFQDDGVLESVMDALDMFPASSEIPRAISHLFAQASGHKSCRALISPQHLQWLDTKSRQTTDRALRAAAAVALIKISRGAGADSADVGGGGGAPPLGDDEDLVRLMRGLVVNEPDPSSLADAVEGLAYTSTDPNVKDILAKDSPFLARLFSIVPRRKGSAALTIEAVAKSPLYGVVVIALNICAYRPRLSDEEAQLMKLRRMANNSGSASRSSQESNPLDDDDHVRKRGKMLIDAGVLDAMTAAVRASGSRAVRLAVGKVLLSLAEDKENRGKILQVGGAKALITIIQGILPSPDSRAKSSQQLQLEPAEVEPIQALAKLAITSSPVQVFGPNEGSLYDAVRPFAVMLINPSTNLLQRFEALMALTNLSSQSGDVATRIARAEGLLNKVELLMLEEHVMMRRAATELVCNLVSGCEDVFNRYGGQRSAATKSKLQVLIALCDVEDLPTGLAAAGAVAILTSSPDACQMLLDLQRERHRALRILGQLVDPSVVSAAEEERKEEQDTRPDPGLVHRGVVCIRNLFLSIRELPMRKELATEADRIGVTQALVGVIKSSGDGTSPALKPAAEAIKWLLESGIEITI